MQNETASMTVYVVLTMGTDYYDSYEFHSVYTDRERAEEMVAHLQTREVPLDERLIEEVEFVYGGVMITESVLH
jgi:hypothetical protein